MKYRIYEIKTKEGVYYIVKQLRWFFYMPALSEYLTHCYYDELSPKHFNTFGHAKLAVEKAIEHDNIPTYKKVVLEIDVDRDYPNI